MNLMNQISQAIKSNAKQPARWTANLAMIFSFAIIAFGYLAYNNVQTNLVKAQSGEWYSVGGTWGYRQKLTIDGAKVTGNLTDFPVLIQITNVANPLFSKALSNGYDILFTSNDGITKLDHEIEKYDGTNGELVAWVKRSLSASTGTEMYMYYGNATASNQGNPAGVWDTNFKMIQHLNDDSATTTKDSTANGNTGTKIAAGQPVETVGKIGMAQSFNGNGKISTPLNTAFGDFTVEVWFKDASPVSSYERLLDKSYTLGFWLGRENAVANSWGGGIRESSPPYGIFGTFSDGVWNHLVSVRSGTTHLLYANGVLVNSNTVSGTLLNNTPIALGAWSDPSQTQQRLSGTLDEVRISDTPRSADWIKTSYSNESDPSTFVSFGPEETPGPVANMLFGSPQAGAIWVIDSSEQIVADGIIYNRPNETFPISLSICLTRSDLTDYCLPTPLTTVTIVTSDVGLFQFRYTWDPVGYLDGSKINEDLSRTNAFFSADIQLGGIPPVVFTGKSEKFSIVIDYGPVADLGFAISMNGQPLHNEQLAIETAFTLSATAKDEDGNLLTDFNIPLDLSVSGVPTFNYSTLGNGSDTGTWSNGTVSFDEYQLFVSDQNLGSLPLTISIGIANPFPIPGPANRTIDNLILNKYGIFIFEPNGGTTWNINDTETITYRFGGFTPPAGSVGRFFYSQNEGADFVAIKDELGNDLELPYSSLSELNYAWLLNEDLFTAGNLGNKFFQIKAQFVDEGGTPAIPDDDVQLSETTTDSFIITDLRTILQGTYTSAKFDISTTPNADTFSKFSEFDPLISGSVPGFVATYNENAGYSDVEFALRFFDADDGSQNILGTAVHPDGWFVLDDQDFDASMLALNDFSWLSQIKQIQFRIKMQTNDYDHYSPYVETLSLNYQIDTLEPTEVGVINFNPNDDSGSHKSVVKGNSVNFGVQLNITGGHESEISQVTLNSTITGASGVTINPVTLNCGGAIISCPATIIVSASSTATLGVDWPISITVMVTGHPEMFFSPNPLQGYLTITDVTAQDFSITWVSGADTNKTVQPGGMASYNFIVTWDQNYSYDIVLTTNITIVIGTSYIEKVEYYNSDGTLITGNTLVKPVASPYTRTVEMRVTTKTNGGEKALTTFNITGEGNGIKKNISPAPSLTISNQPTNTVTIDAKAVVEGGVAGDYQTPTFNLRLYKKGVSGSTGLIVQKSGIKVYAYSETTKQATIRFAVEKATTATTGKLVEGDTYIGYLRSTRHLWQKATTPTNGEITITTTGTTYTLEFPVLIAGDISPAVPDDEINSIDFGAAIADFGKIVSGLLPDFDNNGQINVLDLSFIIINYFKRSALMP